MQTIARKVASGAVAAAIAMAGVCGAAWAADPTYTVDVKTKSDTDCTGASVDSNIPSGAGTLRLSVKGVCTFLWIKEGETDPPTPVVLRDGNKVKLDMAGDRKWFDVSYDLPDKNACLEYFFRLTAGSNLPTETVGKLNHFYICGGK